MFNILMARDHRLMVVTDNAILAEEIRREGSFPVYFTRGPSREVARGLAEGLTDTFGSSLRTFLSDNEDGTWSVRIFS